MKRGARRNRPQKMTAVLSWVILPDEKINVMTEDGVNIALFAGRAGEGAGNLDVAPRFRYVVQISAISLEDFAAASGKLLFDAGLLAIPFAVESGAVTSVALTNLNQRMTRISHGPQSGSDPAEAEVRKQCWTTQHYRHHRSPPMRPKSPPHRDS